MKWFEFLFKDVDPSLITNTPEGAPSAQNTTGQTSDTGSNSSTETKNNATSNSSVTTNPATNPTAGANTVLTGLNDSDRIAQLEKQVADLTSANVALAARVQAGAPQSQTDYRKALLTLTGWRGEVNGSKNQTDGT